MCGANPPTKRETIKVDWQNSGNLEQTDSGTDIEFFYRFVMSEPEACKEDQHKVYKAVVPSAFEMKK